MANPSSSISLAGAAVLLLPLAALLFSFASLQAAQGAMAGLDGGGGGGTRRLTGYVPVRAVVYRSVALPLPAATTTASADETPGGGGGGGGGGYEPFELCMACRCCAGSAAGNASSSCVDTRCCYAIDCNIPGKPFGVCAFSPRTCGCGGGGAGNNNCTTS